MIRPPIVPGICAAALAFAAAAGPAAAQEPPPPPAHPSAVTGWARAPVAGEPLRDAPDVVAAAVAAIAWPGLGGRVQRVARGADGEVWVRVAFPDGVRGWAPGTALIAAPAPAALAPGTRRRLTRLTASLGTSTALVVRDPLGRTLFAAGTRTPLSIASVTKLATVTAALERRGVTLPAAAAILRPSDNDRAQALSTRVGDGSRALGALRAIETAAALGATMTLVDGSGLSPANRASAGEVADLLLGLRDTAGFRTIFRAMPVASRSGTLQYRMAGTAAAGRLRAKTGTLFDPPRASALAGYVWPHGSGLSPDRALVVVMLSNRVSPYAARAAQDAVATALAASGALTAG